MKTAVLQLLAVSAIMSALTCFGESHEPVVVTVLDSDAGRPVTMATVPRIQPGQTLPVAVGQTDADGRISLDCNPQVRMAYVVTASGRTPQTFGFWGCVPPTYQVVLQPPAGSMSGRLEDAAGKPIAGAPVRLVFFDQLLLEPVFDGDEYPMITFPMEVRTDDAGRFILSAAPKIYIDHILFEQAGKWLGVTYTFDDDIALRSGAFVGRPSGMPGPRAQTVPPVPTPVLTIHLRVLDAKTNQPIQRVHVVAGGSDSPDQPFRPMVHSGLDLHGDNVTWTFYDHAWAYFLRVEADGYATAPTRMVKASEKTADLELKLNPTTQKSLVVLTPDGHPAMGAKAYIATPTVDLQVATGDTDIYTPEPFAVAGVDGVLHFSPPDEAYRLAILHSQGSAEYLSTDGGEKPVNLTPWASINLSFGSDGHPLAGVFVTTQDVRTKPDGNLFWSGAAHSDDAGIAALTSCRPCSDFLVNAQPRAAEDGQTRDGWSSLQLDQELKPGQHINLRVLPGGTTVQAVLAQPPGYQWTWVSVDLRGPATGLPPDINQLPQAERTAALQQALRRKSNPHAGEAVVRNLSPVLRKDGSIAITGLRAGVYALTGFSQPVPGAAAQSPTNQPGKPPRLDRLFAIPDSEPPLVDLGTIVPGASQSPGLQTGQIVPDFDSTALDGKPFHLKDLRGHWVLLDFWGVWCGFCLADEPILKDAWEGRAIDRRLTMVSASVNDTPEQVRKHVAEKQLHWTQLALGPLDKTQIPKAFGVNGYPTIILISPEGKVVKADLRGGSLREALISLLGTPSPPRASEKDGGAR